MASGKKIQAFRCWVLMSVAFKRRRSQWLIQPMTICRNRNLLWTYYQKQFFFFCVYIPCFYFLLHTRQDNQRCLFPIIVAIFQVNRTLITDAQINGGYVTVAEINIQAMQELPVDIVPNFLCIILLWAIFRAVVPQS